MSDFGDTEPDDLISANGDDPDPMALAIRLHEIRDYLEALAGRPLPDWHELTPEQQQLAIAIMRDIVEWLRGEGHFDP